MSVFRSYTEKKPGFRADCERLHADLANELSLRTIETVRIVNRYDIEGIEETLLETVRTKVFGEPAVDDISDKLNFTDGDFVLAVAYLPGQFDQRADSCEQCVQLITKGLRPKVKCAKIYIFSGLLSDADKTAIQNYLINPVDSCAVSLDPFKTLDEKFDTPAPPETLTGFCKLNQAGLETLRKKLGLAMDFDDIAFCQKYFSSEEKRDPTITEIRIIDTYWSDHCRHTTFLTVLNDIKIEDEEVKSAFEQYLKMRETVYGEKAKTRPITLMDIATIVPKYLKKIGKLTRLDASEEINACSVKITPKIDGKPQDWLLMFKNETHNHPTEIEPFGGAATCLGGAIRDPLSGRAYCHQAMRVTGAADPNTPFEKTLPNKLPQRKICLEAAAGFSSYGNQIGLATGMVSEIYHPGYAAKRLETGAIIAAAPAKNVRRETPVSGDVIILLGGKTGRDGCGGATGSSKAHNVESLQTCGAEVQKGNPPEERKIQRLFRDPKVTAMIKRCNDFGAGGVSVAIGELADGLNINLDAVPKKYEGLDATELAISESQERMAVVVAQADMDKFIEYAAAENLDATLVAVVTDDARMTMISKGQAVASLSRDFLNSNGASKNASVRVKKFEQPRFAPKKGGLPDQFNAAISSLNAASQKGLGERFDGTIGAGTVLMPYGGKTRTTPQQAMVALLPVLGGQTDDCSMMAYGFNADICAQNPFFGAFSSVVSSVGKLVAAGAPLKTDAENCWLSLQEFFPSPRKDPERWALPFCALLGALKAQVLLGFAAIGGKDSMSGSFENIDVPPTLISFAVSETTADRVISCEFKDANHPVYLIAPKAGSDLTESIPETFNKVEKLIGEKKILSAYSLTDCSAAEALCKMGFGNDIGVKLACVPEQKFFFDPLPGGFLVEAESELDELLIGTTTADGVIQTPDGNIEIGKLRSAWEKPLESVYRTKVNTPSEIRKYTLYTERGNAAPAIKTAQPTVFIPVFPGTNCEYDVARRFDEAGAKADIFVIKNRSAADVAESVENMVKHLEKSQILMIPGGFSGGDEPDGSGKFITAFFNNPDISSAINGLLYKRDGLALGICNGFQALIKLGLVPFGDIRPMTAESPTLTFNAIGRHQSIPVRLKVVSVKSPWMKYATPGEVYTIPVSHGEGRFVADPALIEQLAQNGQIATVYVDENSDPTMKMPHNPNGSMAAVEGITSPDGRVFGKMGHDERCGKNLLRNVGGSTIDLFRAGVDYFK
ncbi:MAG TPA: phosphoribosylformylglycinamidine synthase [Oscillospiraceae bacterium]|nr:phosphoribosylformylglycinamidine synthase [Oscillospiraceae bacterium]HPK35564.1 phosphoribosylformylglycinamidine synthase [Oscillospiraceae bacterium]HPR75899.1 phosphoribosylformylglycinamidine synthase [Oscillospiraceae bacterium]